MPAEFLPATGLAKIAYREAFLNVVDRWAKDQKVNVLLHTLKEHSKTDLEVEDSFDEAALNGIMYLNEVDFVKQLNNPYLFAMPIGHDGTDLIATAEQFLVASNANSLTVNPAGAEPRPELVQNPVIVTLIPGHSWKHIGDGAVSESKTVEQRMIMMSPLIAALFNFATNPVIRAMMVRKLGYN